MADLDTLRMLAGKASSAPWFMHDFTDPLINRDPTAADVTVSCDHPASITVAAMGGGLDGFQGVNQARFDATYIAACDPQTILALLDRLRDTEAASQLRQERLVEANDENERLRTALTECAAEWRSPPTTMGRALEHVSAEFKRRMQVAADALSAHP